LVTALDADNRERVDQNVAQRLNAMKKVGLVVKPSSGKAYFATAHGLAWLERLGSPATDIQSPDQPVPSSKPESKDQDDRNR
jgi:hypothetical protein